MYHRVFSVQAATRESGDVIAAGRVDAEIGEVVAGAQPGRRFAEEITLFKSVGVAVEDVVTADLVYRKALRVGSHRGGVPIGPPVESKGSP